MLRTILVSVAGSVVSVAIYMTVGAIVFALATALGVDPYGSDAGELLRPYLRLGALLLSTTIVLAAWAYLARALDLGSA